jgi:hypothetical protein
MTILNVPRVNKRSSSPFIAVVIPGELTRGPRESENQSTLWAAGLQMAANARH